MIQNPAFSTATISNVSTPRDDADAQPRDSLVGVESALARLPVWACQLTLIFFGWFLFGFHVGERGLWSAHEGRAAQNAQTMLDDGDWRMPTLFTGEADLQKPPLYYWLVATAAKVFGDDVDGLSVRLPACLAAIVGLFITFSLGRSMWDAPTGFSAAIILATTTRYAWLGRVGRIDMPLCVITLACLSTYWRTMVHPRDDGAMSRRTPWRIFVLLGFGALLKGPVVVVLVGLPIAAFLWWTGSPIAPGFQPGWKETWRRHRVVPGAALIAALTAPWFLYAAWATNGEYFTHFFFHHNVARALGTDEALHAGPFWFYIPRLLVDAFPWSLLFPALAISLAKRRDRNPAQSHERTFLLAWIFSLFAFLSMVSFKRADYLLPIYPAVALLLAGWLTERWRRFAARITTRPVRNPHRRARTILITAIGLVVISAPLWTWGAIAFHKKGIVEQIFRVGLAEKHFNNTDRFMMDHVEQLLREHVPLLVIAGAVVIGCVWLVHTGWHERRNARIVAGLAAPWLVVFLTHIHVLLPALDPLRGMARFGEEIRTLATKSRPIYYFGKFDADLIFHAGRPARLIHDWDELEALCARPEPSFVVVKADLVPAIARNPKTVSLTPLRDNRQTAFGEHRDARVLLVHNIHATAAGQGALLR